MLDFKKLHVYKEAKALHAEIYTKVVRVWKGERYFKDQLGRVSLSICLNIAEGNADFSPKSKRRYFTIARASLFETLALLEILKNLGEIDEQVFNATESKCGYVSALLWKLIKSQETRGC